MSSVIEKYIQLLSTKSKINKNNIYILRPLLNISKKDLAYVVKNTYKFSLEDPSNKNEKFLRIKIRNLINKLKKDGLTFKNFNKTLDNLNKSDRALEFYVNKNITDNSKLLNRNKSIIINEIFFQQPDEIVFRSLSQLIHFVGNKNNFARGKKVSNLINNINFSKNLKKQTLSGCIIEKVNKSLIISREN